MPHYDDVNHREPQTQNEKLFSKYTRRLTESVKGLNSSLAQSTGELRGCKKLQTLVTKVAVVGLKGLKKGRSSKSGFKKAKLATPAISEHLQ